MDRPRKIRHLYVVSIILFVLFCLLPGVKPLVEADRPSGFSVTGLVAQLAGIFAWSLMCTAYQMRGKLEGKSPESGK